MQRITDFALVQYFVPYGRELPKEVEDYLRLCLDRYAVERSTGKSGRLYTIPRYLMTQWREKYEVVKA